MSRALIDLSQMVLPGVGLAQVQKNIRSYVELMSAKGQLPASIHVKADAHKKLSLAAARYTKTPPDTSIDLRFRGIPVVTPT